MSTAGVRRHRWRFTSGYQSVSTASAGCSSLWHSPASRSRSMPAWTTGSEGGGDCSSRRRASRPTMARTALRWGAVALAVVLFLLPLRRAGERAGRIAERLEARENSDAVHRRMLEAAAHRPRGRDEPARQLPGGEPEHGLSYGRGSAGSVVRGRAGLSEVNDRPGHPLYPRLADHEPEDRTCRETRS